MNRPINYMAVKICVGLLILHVLQVIGWNKEGKRQTDRDRKHMKRKE